MNSGSINPYLADKTIHLSENFSAKALLTLNGAPMYAFFALAGPWLGSFFQIFA